MTMNETQLERIRALSEAKAPSGFEDETLAVARACLDDRFDVREDSLRNLYIRRKRDAGSSRPVLMLDAHSDEVGFMIHSIRPNGTLRFVQLGGWSAGTLPGTPVRVHSAAGDWVRGVIAAKPPHFLTAEERAANRIQPIQSLVIDVGATSDREAREAFHLRIGEPAVADTPFAYDAANGLMFGKAFDCRIGCAALLETMLYLADKDLDIQPVGVLSSQEEVGERGCKVSVGAVRPDIAVCFEGCPADDTFSEPYAVQTALKQGPMLRFMDTSVICNPRFQRFSLDLAEREGLPVQASVREGGGNDAAVIQAALPAPSIVLGIPVRYIHAPACITARADYEAAVGLASALCESLNADLIGSF